MMRRKPLPVISAGDPELTFCATCQTDTRWRIPLNGHDGTPLGTLELCPGCGSSHAQPSVTVTPPSRTLLPRRRHDGPGCAWRDCQRPDRPGFTVEVPGDAGVWRYYFCRQAHKDAWLKDNGLAQGG